MLVPNDSRNAEKRKIIIADVITASKKLLHTYHSARGPFLCYGQTASSAAYDLLFDLITDSESSDIGDTDQSLKLTKTKEFFTD